MLSALTCSGGWIAHTLQKHAHALRLVLHALWSVLLTLFFYAAHGCQKWEHKPPHLIPGCIGLTTKIKAGDNELIILEYQNP